MPSPTLNQRSDFHFDLPPELIAQRPLATRTGSRLLHVAGESIVDRDFITLPDLVRPNDILVFNDTRVIPARVQGQKPTGGRVEILLERVIGARRILAQVGSSKALRADVPIDLPNGVQARFIAKHEDLFELELNSDPVEFFQKHGAMPLPPYIERGVEQSDAERYQTVFARELGAVAAPTAGLHFDQVIIDRCKARGAEVTYLTLHVGAGTFQPLRVDNVDEHRMHAEFVRVSAEVCEQIAVAKAKGGRVIAVGTTVVRSLETAAASGRLLPFEGDTQIFIRPGYKYKAVDLLVTNFHLPESTLLMLVCAFGGYENVMRAYQHAVSHRYRFFSYGDAMLLEKCA